MASYQAALAEQLLTAVHNYVAVQLSDVVRMNIASGRPNREPIERRTV